MKIFETAAALAAATLAFGQLVETKGYNSAGDGGEAKYLITAGASSDTVGSPDLVNAVHAALMYGDVPNVRQYGATGDGVTDDALAFQAAIDAADVEGVLTLYVPKGDYILGTELSPPTELFGLMIIGDGLYSTTLKGSHSEGAVIKFNRSGSGCRNLTIGATTARNTGLDTSTGGSWEDNVGLLFEPEDTASKSVAHCIVDNVRIMSQPSHGMVSFAVNQLSRYDNVLVQDNLGHGAVFDRGTLSGRTNQGNPGLFTMTNFWALDNGGNGLVCGNPSDTAGLGAVRAVLINAEFTGNATDATVRHSNDQAWVRGENCSFINPAFGGTTSTGGLRWSGRDMSLIAPRFIACTSSVTVDPDEVSNLTLGLTIDGMRVVTTAQNPSIVVSDTTNCRDFRISTSSSGNITSMFTAGAIQAVWNIHEPVTIVRKAADQTVNNSTTLVDDTELQIPLAASETVTFSATLRYVSDATADFKLVIDGATGIVLRWNNSNTIYYGSGDTVSVSNEESEGSERAYGGSASARMVTVSGYATNGSTAGNLKIQFAQQVATVVDTKILIGSSLTVYRDNYQV